MTDSIATPTDKDADTVYETTDYSKFSTQAGNRPLNESHVKKLVKSINEKNLLRSSPLIVNDNLEIIDGQHRLEAAKRLGVPVYYIKAGNLDLKDIQRLNSNNKNWGLANYLEAYCILGNNEYKVFRDFLQNAGIPINTGLLLVYGSGNGDSSGKNQAFRDGLLKIESLSELNNELSMLFSFKPFYEGYLRRSFVLAVLRLRKLEQYNHTQMIEKLKFQSTKLVDCTGVESYLRLLEEIYNYHNRGEQVRFM